MDTDELNMNIFKDLRRTFNDSVIGQLKECLERDVIPRLKTFIASHVAVIHSAKKVPLMCRECKKIYAGMGYGQLMLWDNIIFQVIICVFILILNYDEAFASIKYDEDKFLCEYHCFAGLGDPNEFQKLFHYRNFMGLGVKVVIPKKGKYHLMQLIHRMTRAVGDKEILVTGGGQSDYINRRETIYEKEGDVIKKKIIPNNTEIQNFLLQQLFQGKPAAVAKVDSVADREQEIATFMSVLENNEDVDGNASAITSSNAGSAPAAPIKVESRVSSHTCHMRCQSDRSVCLKTTSVAFPPEEGELDDDNDYLFKDPIDWLATGLTSTELPPRPPSINSNHRKRKSTHTFGFLSKEENIVYTSYERVTTTTFNSETDKCIDEFDLLEGHEFESIPANFGEVLHKRSRKATTVDGETVICEKDSYTMFPVEVKSLSAEAHTPADLVRVLSQSNPEVESLFSFQRDSGVWREESIIERMQSTCGFVAGLGLADGSEVEEDEGMFLNDEDEAIVRPIIDVGIAKHKDDQRMDIDPITLSSLNIS